jgi:hypothetical protein
MAGKKCHKCGHLTVFQTPTGGECSNCGYKYEDKPGSGRGYECYKCGTSTVINGKCTRCGAQYSG